jgi:hypothetical protein
MREAPMLREHKLTFIAGLTLLVASSRCGKFARAAQIRAAAQSLMARTPPGVSEVRLAPKHQAKKFRLTAATRTPGGTVWRSRALVLFFNVPVAVKFRRDHIVERRPALCLSIESMSKSARIDHGPGDVRTRAWGCSDAMRAEPNDSPRVGCPPIATACRGQRHGARRSSATAELGQEERELVGALGLDLRSARADPVSGLEVDPEKHRLAARRRDPEARGHLR